MVSMFEGPSTGEDVAGGALDDEVVGTSGELDVTGSSGVDVLSGITSEVEVEVSSE
jgi:Ca2+-binding RTX toxin-like protein